MLSEIEKERLRRFGEVGAIITDSHIVYTSGKHGSAYVNKDAIYPHTHLTCDLCKDIATAFAKDNVEVVLAPEKGGIILSQWVAYWLQLNNISSPEILSAYAEKDDDGFVLKRGYGKIVSGKRVLVVEDLLNTGGSAFKTVELARSVDANVIGVGALCNRGNVTARHLGDVPKLFSLVNVSMEAFNADSCPLCRTGVPINTTVGHGKQFLAERV